MSSGHNRTGPGRIGAQQPRPHVLWRLLLDLRQEIRNVILEKSGKLRLNFAPLCLQAGRLFHFKRYSLTGLNASGLFKVYLSIAVQDEAVQCQVAVKRA